MQPFRQVHLDFHTHGSIDDIGTDFDPVEFADTLVEARVNSINLFARCHHGYLYYDSKRFPESRHPHLVGDLLPRQIEACRARGIKAPIYVSVQWDALMADRHPEWLVRAVDGKVNIPAFNPGFYNTLCLNTDYESYLRDVVGEIMERLPVDGFWFDILLPYDCSCGRCRDGMIEQGLDPSIEAVRRRFAIDTLSRFKRSMTDFVAAAHTQATIFYNSGHIGPSVRRDLDTMTHLELESLPSGQWGYSHYPSTVRFARTLGKQTLGMTGKFHTTWGDFHSFKNPEALAFECFSMLAHGAQCCVGDQLHPRGRLCPTTYELIGSVYREVEKREPWCAGAEAMVDIGVLTPEEFTGGGRHTSLPAIIKGAMRLLQELHHQFDIIDSQADFGRYRVLILPDEIPVDEALAEKIKRFLARGGRLIASHQAGLTPDGGHFALDLGVKRLGPAPFTPMFLKPRADFAGGLAMTEHVMQETGTQVQAQPGAEILADNISPYFNRTWRHYCSHRHAPSSGEVNGPGIVRSGSTIYFTQPIFTQYHRTAPRWCRTLLANALERLLPEPLIRIQAPPTLVATVTHQANLARVMVHLMHYVPVRTCEEMDVVDGVIPLHDVAVSVRADDPVAAVRCVPEMIELKLERQSGRVNFTVPIVRGYQMIELSR